MEETSCDPESFLSLIFHVLTDLANKPASVVVAVSECYRTLGGVRAFVLTPGSRLPGGEPQQTSPRINGG